jgi:hypothetical protein
MSKADAVLANSLSALVTKFDSNELNVCFLIGSKAGGCR